MPRPVEFDWTEKAVESLRKWWAEGLSTQAIANRFGPPCTKNAVIGKKNRLGLEGRPSPIKGAAYLQQLRERQAAPKRPPAPKTVPAPKHPPKPEAEKVVLTLVPTPAPEPRAAAPVAAPEPPPTRFLPRAPRDCCWPIGEPRTPEFRFCDAVALLGKPYCQEHYDIAYRPFKPKAEHLADQTAIGAEIANKKGALWLRATMGR